jgi:transposase InsO family protein
LYLSPIIDLFNQEIISYELTERPVFNQVVMMLKKAFKKIPNNTNLTLHSDQGWQYQMKNISIYWKKRNCTKYVKKRELFRQCYNWKLFGILKSELFYLKKYTSLDQLKKEINDYVKYYNNDNKSNLNKMSPIQYRAHYEN